ncbi:hypothetical protein T265_11999 [Opisthorchis viverrini]|uniref:Reverse transcriptase domain-containing protein n=1 Tax=Opisthorchis viverrini TaxID=6198 RepID=A0A074Z7D5_OPIVI|nr:hypothetical protein T265_11999 [Opisthorchis viverrini]KER19115.1 hypothetical protein T265_11999 [Opisthorchis viverrini]
MYQGGGPGENGDDIVVYSNSESGHAAHLKAVLKRIREAGPQTNEAKTARSEFDETAGVLARLHTTSSTQQDVIFGSTNRNLSTIEVTQSRLASKQCNQITVKMTGSLTVSES